MIDGYERACDQATRCTSETWHDDQKRVVRCDQTRGHGGHHGHVTEFWAIFWTEEQAFERSRYLSAREIADAWHRPIGTVRRLASTEKWARTADRRRPVLYRVLDVEKTMDRLGARHADKRT